MNGWALDDSTIERLIVRLDELRPSVILECGSGVSTVHIARWSDAHGANFVSLEHKREFADKTLAMVGDLPVDLRCAPLSAGFYDTELPDNIDFALIDGPPGAGIGRTRTLPTLWPRLSQEFEVWLDDANRDHERDCLDRWAKDLPIDVSLDSEGKGLAVIRRSSRG